jgi:8-oxo-dGTP pyrophosphatase MutT (NUDIX family)
MTGLPEKEKRMSAELRTCTTVDGRTIALPRTRFVVRPSVYALVIHAGTVLLVTNTRSGRFYLPGGGVEPGEALVEALAREVWEEAGITIADPQLRDVHEDFWYFDPTDSAYHALLFLYVARPESLELSGHNQVDDGEDNPRWVPIAGLRAEDFHNHGERLLGLIHDAAEVGGGAGQSAER